MSTKFKIAAVVIALLVFGQVLRSASLPTKQTSISVAPTVGLTTAVDTVTSAPQKILFQVVKVIDGDTIDVSIDGKTERIRLIGVDTPEVVDPRKPVQCFGKEASAKIHKLLDGKKVSIESDQSQGNKDKYSRLLRYVFTEDGINIALEVISSGFGHEYTYDLPYKYQKDFKEAQEFAEKNGLGLWAPNACVAPTALQVFTQQAIEPTQQPAPAQSSGFICSGKTKCGEMVSCEEARFYLTQCDVSRLDGDDDGTPCESLCE